jgi:hypothetical protein
LTLSSTPCLQNLKESTLGWRFAITHCPGKWQRGPDALLRYPSHKANLTHTDTLFALISEDPTAEEIADSDEANTHTQVTTINFYYMYFSIS